MFKALILLGPTAVGKSGIALEVARAMETSIISADSVQVYKHLDIGSAKPVLTIREEVPHYLIDIVEPDEDFDAGIYLTHAQKVIPSLTADSQTILIAGGTGLYIRAIVDGLVEVPGKSEELRAELYRQIESGGEAELFQRLQRVDPAYAEVVHTNDHRRVVRALEIYELTGKPFSSLHNGTVPSFPEIDFIQIGLFRERGELHKRINQRVDEMFAKGLVEEVESLINEQGYSPDLNSLKSLGYRQVIQYLNGEFSLEVARDEIKKQTRRFAKRQMTWFNKDKRIKWLNLDLINTNQAVIEQIQKEFPELWF